jgi:hypothetical protein
MPITVKRLGALAGYTSWPIPRNNKWIHFGDSRVSIDTENGSTEATPRTTAYGSAAWCQHTSNYRGRYVGNYGVNANTLDQMITRLTNVETRGQVLSNDAGVCVFTGGVNNTNESISTVGPKYDTIIKTLVDSGFVVLWENELPNTDQSTQGAANLGRRDYIDNAYYPGYMDRIIKVPTYDALAAAPRSYFFREGLRTPPDLLHPNLAGNRIRGQLRGAILDQLYAAAGYGPRAKLASKVGTGAPMFVGTGGSLGGAGASGVMSDGWSPDVPPTGLTVVYSKATDPDGYDQQVVTVTGTAGALGTTQQWNLANYGLGGAWAKSGDTVQHVCRVIVDSGNVGLCGLGVGQYVNNNDQAIFQNGVAFGGTVYNSYSLDGGAWGGAPFDGVVMSQPNTLDPTFTASATKSIGPLIYMSVLGGTAVNATIRFSRSTLQLNA